MAGRADELAELPVRHRCAVYPEAIDGDAVNRRFLRIVPVGPHPERAACNPDHAAIGWLGATGRSRRRRGVENNHQQDLPTRPGLARRRSTRKVSMPSPMDLMRSIGSPLSARANVPEALRPLRVRVVPAVVGREAIRPRPRCRGGKLRSQRLPRRRRGAPPMGGRTTPSGRHDHRSHGHRANGPHDRRRGEDPIARASATTRE